MPQKSAFVSLASWTDTKMVNILLDEYQNRQSQELVKGVLTGCFLHVGGINLCCGWIVKHFETCYCQCLCFTLFASEFRHILKKFINNSLCRYPWGINRSDTDLCSSQKLWAIITMMIFIRWSHFDTCISRGQISNSMHRTWPFPMADSMID